MKVLFLDRDGIINTDSGYVYKIKDFLFIDGIFDLCSKAKDAKYEIIVITNQSGIKRGYYTENDFENITLHMIDSFAAHNISILDVFHCPKLDGEDRKPAPGMFLKARDKYDIIMSDSVSVGDSERDIEAALAAGVQRNYLVSTSAAFTRATQKVASVRALVDIFR